MELFELKPFFEAHESFAVIPHKNPDGDALGSCLALCRTLERLGKTARIFYEEKIPVNLQFIWDHSYDGDMSMQFDAAIAVDCADAERLGIFRATVFDRAADTACIDHHMTNAGFANHNYIDPNAAATGEIIYQLAEQLFLQVPDKKTAEWLYCAIASDTGSFKYSNTTKTTHQIAANLIGLGIDVSKLSKHLFDTLSLSQIRLLGVAATGMELYEGGKVALIHMHEAELAKWGLGFDETDYLVSLPRSIEGVEVGIFLKEKGEREIKASFRSNAYINVAEIASSFGGGGHCRAAGATIALPYDDAKQLVLERVSQAFYDGHAKS